MGKIKERVIENNRTTVAGFLGGALSSASLVAGFGITDYRVLAGVAAAGAIAGGLSKDPEWMKKRLSVIK